MQPDQGVAAIRCRFSMASALRNNGLRSGVDMCLTALKDPLSLANYLAHEPEKPDLMA